MSEMPSFQPRAPVPPPKVLVEGVGINALDRRRVDVAVDLTPCQVPVNVEFVIVGPDDDELSSVLLIDNREWMLDKIMHLRRDALAGEYTLHIGVFHEDELMARAAKRFRFPLDEPDDPHG
ncbi:MAG: hypothetical protein PVI80_09380 [Anaerolineae bacterium]